MKTTLSSPCQWQSDDGAWSIGRMVLDETGRYVTASLGVLFEYQVSPFTLVLVCHSHTSELEFVPFGKLAKYPSEPIESPAK
jgi:hypothetical protein